MDYTEPVLTLLAMCYPVLGSVLGTRLNTRIWELGGDVTEDMKRIRCVFHMLIWPVLIVWYGLQNYIGRPITA